MSEGNLQDGYRAFRAALPATEAFPRGQKFSVGEWRRTPVNAGPENSTLTEDVNGENAEVPRARPLRGQAVLPPATERHSQLQGAATLASVEASQGGPRCAQVGTALMPARGTPKARPAGPVLPGGAPAAAAPPIRCADHPVPSPPLRRFHASPYTDSD
ncbi:hypothetical protein [Deinococcus hopiensis]|uniref:hypothetical protein n=1 Tax=Deinococcus hopiensis TaxID=309885 RepID=UPI00111C1292|nr:hypothetical protein [Deinococcus hopiensis]